jgi:signal transduction histidine kinase
MVNNGNEIIAATRIAKRSIVIIAALIAAVFLVFVTERIFYQSKITFLSSIQKVAQEARHTILFSDEVLTGSARAFAATARLDDRVRYDAMVRIMNDALAKARSVASSETADQFLSATSVANDKLIAMETKSFELAAQGRLTEAHTVMHSTLYNYFKDRLKRGTDAYLRNIAREIESQFAKAWSERMKILAVMFGIVLAAFALVWRSVTKAMDKSEAAFLAADQKIRHELLEVHDANIRNLRMVQLGQLTATVAHELRNPLGAVRTSTFLLQRKTQDKGLGLEPLVQRIDNGISRCDEIITQLLDFSRTSAPKFARRKFDDWVCSVVEDMAPSIPASINITCDLGLEDLEVEFDEGRMRRCLINLISNASEAMCAKDGSVLPEMKLTPAITLSTRKTPQGVAFQVEDNGPGISPENLERIMDPLFTTKSFGTGLGLPAVRKILEQHGGGLKCTSETGNGAQFMAWIKIDHTQAATGQAA